LGGTRGQWDGGRGGKLAGNSDPKKKKKKSGKSLAPVEEERGKGEKDEKGSTQH